jgi:hypothetical protein
MLGLLRSGSPLHLNDDKDNGRTSVNFTNILGSTFARLDRDSTKNTGKPSVFFALLGSARVKASRKYVGEINPISYLLLLFARKGHCSLKMLQCRKNILL